MKEIKNKKINNKGPVSPSQGGFTLIELMVATALFVVIMLSAMGSLFVLLDESKDSRSLRVAMDNVNFAMESMTRSIRMGVNYSDGDNLLSFNLQDGKYVKYQFIEGTYDSDEKWINGTIKRVDSSSTDGVSIVSPDVNIDLLKFFVTVPDVDNLQVQPSVYIILKGTVSVNGVSTSFALQTMASQRNFLNNI